MSADPSVRPERRRCAVLGSPIGHSLSPVLHRAAYDGLGLDWTYGRVEVGRGDLAAFLDGLDESWLGLSLTMPLKEEALAVCGNVDPPARTAAAVNTLVRESAGWSGSNTDVPGAVDALRSAGIESIDAAIVVGAGATARSALCALAELGVRSVTVLARAPHEAASMRALGERLGVRVQTRPLRADVPPADVVVSTVPSAAVAPLAERLVEHCAAVFDVVYDPPDTPLLRAAESAGRRRIGGLDLLLHQAGHQVRRMTGREPPLLAMRTALNAAAGTGPVRNPAAAAAGPHEASPMPPAPT